jgi:hypothetical protein
MTTRRALVLINGVATELADADILRHNYVFPVNITTTGSVNRLVTSAILPAGVYTTVGCTLGCALSGDTATLTLVNPSLTTIATITHTGTPLYASTSGFTLGADTEISFYLKGNLQSTNAFIYGIEIN